MIPPDFAQTEFDASPEAAVAGLAAHSGPIYVDLDETLYLRNSTEDFIDTARPGVLACAMLLVLDFLRPWRWTGGESTRDSWRVGLIRTLFPWTRWRWRNRVQELSGQFANRALVGALEQRRDRVVIVTAGFMPVVAPLVAALGFGACRIIAARVGFRDRRAGKLHMVHMALGQDALSQALFLTDSIDDHQVLAGSRAPYRVIWPGAHYPRALARVYVPGLYVTQVKRPGERYFWRSVVQEDLAFWVLGSLALAAHPVAQIAGLSLMLLSFWTIYERGYADNDWAAANLESDGKLSAAFWGSPVATPRVQPWLWAAISGGAAMYLLSSASQLAVNCIKWAAVLAVTYLVFRLYNRVNKPARVWLYSLLQLARVASVLVIVAVVPVGAMALGAVVLARWVSYYYYRLSPGDWPDLRINVMRLLFFLILAGLLGAATGGDALFNWTALALLIWCVYRARTELVPLFREVHRIDRNGVEAGAELRWTSQRIKLGSAANINQT